jgi:hypothetical protein
MSFGGLGSIGYVVAPGLSLLNDYSTDKNNKRRAGLELSDTDPRNMAMQRNSDIEQGRSVGREIFYSPEMQEMSARNKDLSQGYTGQELGALRQQAQSQIQGQRGGYLRQLQGRAAKGGIGGARAAAMQASADRGFAGAGAEAERKMLADNSALIRQANKDYQDFALRQKYGELGTGLSYGQLGAGDRASAGQARAANNQARAAADRGILGNLLGGTGIF